MLLQIRNNIITVKEYDNRKRKLKKKKSKRDDIFAPLHTVNELEKDLVQFFMKEAVFEDIILSEKNYDSPNFEKTSFKNSLFMNVSFQGGCLKSASFRSCRLNKLALKKDIDCKNTDFSDAVFLQFEPEKHLDFENSNFSEADFSEQGKLSDLSFRNCNMQRTNFNTCLLENLDFENIDGEELKLNGSQLVNVNFKYANLKNANLTDCDLYFHELAEQTDDSGQTGTTKMPTMLFVNLSFANFFHAKLINLQISYSRLMKTNVIECDLTHCDAKDTYCNDISFVRSKLKNVSFDRSLLNRGDFSNAQIEGNSTFFSALLIDSLFINTAVEGNCKAVISFAHAQFLNTQFIHARFCYCDFTEAVFDGAVISADTVFENCKFQGARLENADLLGCHSEIFKNCSNVSILNQKKNPIPNQTQDNTLELIVSRRSIRGFRPDPISPDIIPKLLEAARWAPSAKNRQPWFYCICGEKSIHAIAAFMREKGPELEATATALESAPVLMLVFYRKASAESPLDTLPDTLSIGASVENILLFARSLHLGSLWVCDILDVESEIKDLLMNSDLPSAQKTSLKSCDLVSAVSIGYYTEGKIQSSDVQELTDWHGSYAPRHPIDAFTAWLE